MSARKQVVVISIAAIVMLFSVSTCGGDPDAFQGTVVAPLETLSALTPGPEVYATLTAKVVGTRSLDAAQPATPTPPPASPTPKPATPTPRPNTPTAQPPSVTPQPATPTSPPPAPQEATPTSEANTVLEGPQRVGALGETWNLSDIRVGIHPRKIRVVWEMAEDRATVPLTEIAEVDNSNREPSLASPENDGSQTVWAAGGSQDRENDEGRP